MVKGLPEYYGVQDSRLAAAVVLSETGQTELKSALKLIDFKFG